MNPLNVIFFKRAVMLLPLLGALACVAGADTIYDVSGTFQPSSPSNPFTGPLNGGRFSGTFSATLPVASGSESIFSFNINLFNTSGTVLANLSSASGGNGTVYVETGFCGISSSGTGPCDRFIWGNSSATNILSLITPVGFTGGKTYPGFLMGLFTSSALIGGTSTTDGSFVASGSITPVPEPSTFVLLGLGALALAGFSIKRRRVSA